MKDFLSPSAQRTSREARDRAIVSWADYTAYSSYEIRIVTTNKLNCGNLLLICGWLDNDVQVQKRDLPAFFRPMTMSYCSRCGIVRNHVSKVSYEIVSVSLLCKDPRLELCSSYNISTHAWTLHRIARHSSWSSGREVLMNF